MALSQSTILHASPTVDSLLNSTLQSRSISKSTREEIASKLWGHQDAVSKVGGGELDIYFSYYLRQSHFFDPGTDTYVATHQDIVDVACLLLRNLKREEIKEFLQTRSGIGHTTHADQKLENSIDLTARLLVMLEIGQPPDSFSPYKPLSWEPGRSLREFIRVTFEPRNALLHERVKLQGVFSGQNLVRIGGMKIVWTDNLADHLRTLDQDTEIAIFHHVSFLERMRHR
jgi:hypothetical protein